jgi:broad specificity phosphatase PhoE
MPQPSRRRLSASLAALLVAPAAMPLPSPARAQANPVLGLMRRPGHITFMRHALAPFEGAPRETGATAETLGPCETQRNLDDRGRADARRIGALFRREGVVFERAYTSKWCRCRETAELILGRPVENLPLINSYWSDPQRDSKGPAQIAALKRWLNDELPRQARVLLVTHGSLIHGIAGFWTDETEAVVTTVDGRGGLLVAGRGVP